MVFTCFRRKSKTTYTVSHDYDCLSPKISISSNSDKLLESRRTITPIKVIKSTEGIEADNYREEFEEKQEINLGDIKLVSVDSIKPENKTKIEAYNYREELQEKQEINSELACVDSITPGNKTKIEADNYREEFEEKHEIISEDIEQPSVDYIKPGNKTKIEAYNYREELEEKQEINSELACVDSIKPGNKTKIEADNYREEFEEKHEIISEDIEQPSVDLIKPGNKTQIEGKVDEIKHDNESPNRLVVFEELHNGSEETAHSSEKNNPNEELQRQSENDTTNPYRDSGYLDQKMKLSQKSMTSETSEQVDKENDEIRVQEQYDHNKTPKPNFSGNEIEEEIPQKLKKSLDEGIDLSPDVYEIDAQNLKSDENQEKEQLNQEVSSVDTLNDTQQKGTLIHCVDKSEVYTSEPTPSNKNADADLETKRRSGVLPKKVLYDEEVAKSLVKYAKEPSEEEFIQKALTKNEFLSKVLTGRRLQDVVDAMYLKEIKWKEKIIREGHTGSHMYVAAEGEFEVTKKGKGLVNIIKPGEVFGELAILYNAKRLATVKAATPAKVWVIDGLVYQQLMKKSNMEEQEEIVSFLQNVSILNEAGVEVLKKVATLLKPEFFATGSLIVQEGEIGETFYIISAGSVTVSRKDDGFLRQLHRGQCFGEKALLKSKTRQATITADSPGTECLTLTRQYFIDHFGNIEDISKLSMPTQPEILLEDITIDEEYVNLDLSEFKMLKTLGVGGFGRVEFVQHKKKPSMTYALKYLKKFEMVQQDQQQHVINEVKIQLTCKSPFIIRMYRTYKDNKYIYLLMEVCLGGDLWYLLQKQPNRRFEEKGAKFIAACILEALAYLHERGIVYRDLKPENMLIDNNGYIKLTDFGFAKNLPHNSKSGTFAGTPEYVAPEIILNRGHDKAVDYWAYGIFIFELLTGRTPFRSSDPSYMKTYDNILNGLDIVDFPSSISTKAKNLITKLLRKSPEERLGCLRGGVEDIRKHHWLHDFEWENLRTCRLASPYKPKLSSNVDFRNFDHFRRDNDIPPDETSGWDEAL